MRLERKRTSFITGLILTERRSNSTDCLPGMPRGTWEVNNDICLIYYILRVRLGFYEGS